MNVPKALIISFAILTTSDVVMWKNVDALLSSDSARLNNDDYKLQTVQQKVSPNASPFTSTLPPSDFAFSYSFGIIGETNSTVSSKYNIYMKDNEDAPPTNITFMLSETQLYGIWNSIMKTGFFQIKNNFTENCDNNGNCVLVTPEHYSILKVTGNNSTHTVAAHEGYAFPNNEGYRKFNSLVDEIERMTETVLDQNDNNNNTMPSNDREPERGFI